MYYIGRATGMTINVLVAVSQEHDSSDGMETKQFLNTSILFDCQITTVWCNIGTPASHNLVNLCMWVNIFNAC